MKKIFALLLIVCAFAMPEAAPRAKAAVYSQQLDSSTLVSGYASGSTTFASSAVCIPVSYASGTLAKSFTINYDASGSYQNPLFIAVASYTDANCTSRVANTLSGTTSTCSGGTVGGCYTDYRPYPNTFATQGASQNFAIGTNQTVTFDLTHMTCGVGTVCTNGGYDLSFGAYVGVFINASAQFAPAWRAPVSGTFKVRGSSLSTWSATQCNEFSIASYPGCRMYTPGSMAYILDSTIVPSYSFTSNRVTLSVPASGSVTASTSVSFSGQYYSDSSVSFSAGSLSSVNVRLHRQDGAFGVYAPVDCTTSVSTQNALTSWSCSTVLPPNSTWSATAQLIYGTSALYLSSTSTFSVLSATSLTTAPGTIVDTASKCGSYGFGMNYLCEIIVWAFYPTPSSVTQFSSLTLENSVPFSYLYDMPVLGSELITNSGSEVASVSVAFGGFGHIQLISPALLASVPFATTIRTLLGYVMYFMTAYGIYRIIVNQTHKK